MRSSLSLFIASNLLAIGSSKRLGEDQVTISANGPTFDATNCLDDEMGQALQANGIPGANLAILRQGQIVYEQGYGSRDTVSTVSSSSTRQGSLPLVLPSTPFRIMSISKSITSLTTLVLAQKELLNLDDLVFGEGGVLNGMMEGHNNNVDQRILDITIQHLLEHSAGFPTQLVPGNPTSDPIFSSIFIASELGIPGPVSCVDIIQYMLDLPLDFDPGTNGDYSNLGYCILGRVLEAVTNSTYEAVVQDYLLKPAGVDLTEFYLGQVRLDEIPEQEAKYKAQYPYDFLAPSVYPQDNGQNISLAYGGAFSSESVDALGGWVATSRQLLHVVAAVAPAHCGQNCLLDEEWIDALMAPPTYPWPVPDWYVGLGVFFVERKDENDLVWLFRGDNAGSFGLVETGDEYSYALLANGNNATGFLNGETFETALQGMVACVGEEWPSSNDGDGDDSSAGTMATSRKLAMFGIMLIYMLI